MKMAGTGATFPSTPGAQRALETSLPVVCFSETLVKFMRRYNPEDNIGFSPLAPLPLLICTRIAQYRGVVMKRKVG
jgi:hypothetical protein